jgi:hypothetical protein
LQARPSPALILALSVFRRKLKEIATERKPRVGFWIEKKEIRKQELNSQTMKARESTRSTDFTFGPPSPISGNPQGPSPINLYTRASEPSPNSMRFSFS